MAYIPTETFIADLGMDQRFAGDTCTGTIALVPELCVPGTDQGRVAVLATIADMAAGSISSAAAAPKVCMTVDLSVRPFRPAIGTVRVNSRVLKSGRTTTVAETMFTVGDDLVALSLATFIASPRPQDVLEMPPLTFTSSRTSRLTARLEDQVGCRVVAPGVAEVERVPYVMNPAGTVQGGVVALLGELAAASLVPGSVVTELDIRYLSAVRVGPARAVAVMVGATTARVEVRDAGNADRLTALVLARF